MLISSHRTNNKNPIQKLSLLADGLGTRDQYPLITTSLPIRSVGWGRGGGGGGGGAWAEFGGPPARFEII